MSNCMAAAFLAAEGTNPPDRQWFNDSKHFDPEAVQPSGAGQCVMETSSYEFASGSITGGDERRIVELSCKTVSCVTCVAQQ